MLVQFLHIYGTKKHNHDPIDVQELNKNMLAVVFFFQVLSPTKTHTDFENP